MACVGYSRVQLKTLSSLLKCFVFWHKSILQLVEVENFCFGRLPLCGKIMFVVGTIIIQLYFVEHKWCPKRVQISLGICTPEDWLDRFSGNAHWTTGLNLWKKILFFKMNLFSRFCLDRNLKVKNLNWSVIWMIEGRYFSCCEKWNKWCDGLVKTSLPCALAVNESLNFSWISHGNSIPLCILLSHIPCK